MHKLKIAVTKKRRPFWEAFAQKLRCQVVTHRDVRAHKRADARQQDAVIEKFRLSSKATVIVAFVAAALIKRDWMLIIYFAEVADAF